MVARDRGRSVDRADPRPMGGRGPGGSPPADPPFLVGDRGRITSSTEIPRSCPPSETLRVGSGIPSDGVGAARHFRRPCPRHPPRAGCASSARVSRFGHHAHPRRAPLRVSSSIRPHLSSLPGPSFRPSPLGHGRGPLPRAPFPGHAPTPAASRRRGSGPAVPNRSVRALISSFAFGSACEQSPAPVACLRSSRAVTRPLTPSRGRAGLGRHESSRRRRSSSNYRRHHLRHDRVSPPVYTLTPTRFGSPRALDSARRPPHGPCRAMQPSIRRLRTSSSSSRKGRQACPPVRRAVGLRPSQHSSHAPYGGQTRPGWPRRRSSVQFGHRGHTPRTCRLRPSLHPPMGAASFVLGDSAETVAARSVAETTARLVRALTAYGVSSTEAAYSALGRLMSWVILHHPDAPSIEGSHVSDFLAAEQPSATTLTALTWLRDHCGLAIPARGPVCRPYRCRPPIAPRAKESLSIGAVVSLEYITAHHPSECVRGHAAGWSVIARLALRLEQAQSCVLNAFVQHTYDGESFTIAVGSVRRDKHPNPSKRRPRPIWGVIDGLDRADCIRKSLLEMLSGVEECQFLLRDTDSPDGDPTRATAWVSAPLKGNPRIDASLQALLRLPPASFSLEDASQVHGHAAKRFLLNVAEASAAFTSVEACEVGRFSLSTSQSPDLEPVAAMLQAHSLRASVLPDVYAGKAKVARVFDLLVKAHLALRSARRALVANPALLATGDASWGSAGPFAVERPVSQPLMLTHLL
mmetsp:Transcript_2921/g.6866  ORF Transcript_2921/g.6866 Transcript_2921/m.6866 type:complete len:749 (-) Transcript_2921:86-2332(-)